LADAALTGVLAVAVASPCTAPFMAPRWLGLTLPGAQALALFAALGVGMALPYLAASAWPGLARAMPRPGAWMATFKAAMAFPMLATVVWLAWVLGSRPASTRGRLAGRAGGAGVRAVGLGPHRQRPRARAAWSACGALLLGAVLAWRCRPGTKRRLPAPVPQPTSAGSRGARRAWPPSTPKVARCSSTSLRPGA